MIYIVLNNSPYYGGGVEQVVANIVQRIPKRFQSQLTLICNDPTKDALFSYSRVKCVNFPLKRCPILDRIVLWSALIYSFRIFLFLTRELRDGDVVNIHGSEYALFPSLLRNRIRKDFRYIITAHDSLFRQYSEFVVRGLPMRRFFLSKIFFFFWRFYVYIVEMIGLKGADLCICISKDAREYIKKVFGIDRNQSTVIYNGMSSDVSPKSMPSKINGISVIIVGSSYYLKGVDRAIEIIRKVNVKNPERPITLNIVGFGEFNRNFPRRGMSFEKNIKYIGRVSPEDILEWYRKSDFLLFPSRFEGFPLVVLEALQNGLPVVVSDKCKFKEIPDYEKMGFIVKGNDIDSWVEAILFLKDNLDSFEKNVRKADLSLFSWDNIAAKYVSVYGLDEK